MVTGVKGRLYKKQCEEMDARMKEERKVATIEVRRGEVVD